MRFTQKQKLVEFDSLYAHSELLELYLYDTAKRRKPDAVERPRKDIRVELWRAMSASGGYMVLVNGTVGIHSFEEVTARIAKDSYLYGPDIRNAIECLRVARERLWAKQINGNVTAEG